MGIVIALHKVVKMKSNNTWKLTWKKKTLIFIRTFPNFWWFPNYFPKWCYECILSLTVCVCLRYFKNIYVIVTNLISVKLYLFVLICISLVLGKVRGWIFQQHCYSFLHVLVEVSYPQSFGTTKQAYKTDQLQQ